MKNISFKKATLEHKDIIFKWLDEPHMKEFWDNSQDHKDDILNFIHDRKQIYFYGTTKYWVGYIKDEPFYFVLSDILENDQNLSQAYKKHFSKVGHSISLDYGIGNKKFLGKGLAVLTLKLFMKFYQDEIDILADTFFIDPSNNNPRAKYVYDKAGFEVIEDYIMKDDFFAEKASILMVKKLPIEF